MAAVISGVVMLGGSAAFEVGSRFGVQRHDVRPRRRRELEDGRLGRIDAVACAGFRVRPGLYEEGEDIRATSIFHGEMEGGAVRVAYATDRARVPSVPEQELEDFDIRVAGDGNAYRLDGDEMPQGLVGGGARAGLEQKRRDRRIRIEGRVVDRHEHQPIEAIDLGPCVEEELDVSRIGIPRRDAKRRSKHDLPGDPLPVGVGSGLEENGHDPRVLILDRDRQQRIVDRWIRDVVDRGSRRYGFLDLLGRSRLHQLVQGELLRECGSDGHREEKCGKECGRGDRAAHGSLLFALG